MKKFIAGCIATVALVFGAVGLGVSSAQATPYDVNASKQNAIFDGMVYEDSRWLPPSLGPWGFTHADAGLQRGPNWWSWEVEVHRGGHWCYVRIETAGDGTSQSGWGVYANSEACYF